MPPPITQRTSIRRDLQDHYEHLRYVPLGDLFAEDPGAASD